MVTVRRARAAVLRAYSCSDSPTGVRGSMWRALAVFRVAALGYTAAIVAHAAPGYARPALGWSALVAMAAWTALVTVAQPAADAAGQRGRLAVLVGVDVALAALLVAATRAVDTVAHIEAGAPTLPGLWASGSVLAAAIAAGLPGGLGAAALLSLATVAQRGDVTASTIGTSILLALTGGVLGYLVRAAAAAEDALSASRAERAALAVQERLARAVHDGVLQVLALLARGGVPPEEVPRLAAEQEAALRRLVAAKPVGLAVPTAPAATGRSADVDPSAPARFGRRGRTAGVGRPADLADALAALGAERVTVIGPGLPVPLSPEATAEVVAAVRALLDNVARHAGPGAHAWVLVEDAGDSDDTDDAGDSDDADDAIRVTVRDDGCGMPPGRETEARAAGRLGLAASVRGRLADLGGSVTVTSAPGRGTEVELRVPRACVPRT